MLPFWLQKKLALKYGQVFICYDYTIKDANQKIILHKKYRAKSLTENFISALYVYFSSGGTPSYGFTAPHTANNTMFNTAGTQMNMSGLAQLYLQGIAGDDTNGIVVGIGAPSIVPYSQKLTTRILNGSGLNQLVYGQQTSSNGVTVLGNLIKLTLSRTWNNSSGALITVSEWGLYSFTSGASFNLLIDSINAPVNNLQTLSINLTFETTT